MPGLSHVYVCVNRGVEAKPVIVFVPCLRDGSVERFVIGGRTHRFPVNNASLPRPTGGMRSVARFATNTPRLLPACNEIQSFEKYEGKI